MFLKVGGQQEVLVWHFYLCYAQAKGNIAYYNMNFF